MDDEKVLDLNETELPFTLELDMPDEGQISKWKAQYPDNDIYAVPIAGQTWVYRDIRRQEYYRIRSENQAGTPDQFEIEVVKNCVLYPTDIDYEKGKAGVPSVLADLIFLASGFEPTAAPVKL